MQVMVIGRGLPNERYPLNGIFEYDQAKALEKEGIDVTYVALDLRSIRRKRAWGIHKHIIDNMQVVELNVPGGRIPKKLLYKVGEWILKKYLEKEIMPDVVHAHFTEMAIVATRIFGKRNIPIVITEHSSEISHMNMSKSRYKEIYNAYHRATLVIGVSEHFCKHIKNNFNVEPRCVNNIVDTDSFFYYSQKSYEKAYRFVLTASLVAGKRVEQVIDALHQMILNNINVTLQIIGDGVEKQNLQRRIRELGVEKYITFHGRKSRVEINEIYRCADCFVLVSQSETFGVAYIEALAAGLPVIASRCGGPEDFVCEDNGILVDVDDLEQLVKAMEVMVSHHSIYDKQKISDTARIQFSPNTVARQLCDIYREVIK